ncbi:hypothetical protein [Propionibacterium sp.]|uniref:hypothetical protein n=1 Tax=Propionibacterium sp. TaxID=1977903 RepID=UPI0039E9B021
MFSFESITNKPRRSAAERRADAAAWMRGDHGPSGYTYGVSKLVTGLMVVGGLLYMPTGGWGLIICLVVAIMALIGRRMLEHQAIGDFSDMHEAREQFTRTGNREYLAFIIARGEQMLSDNKALRPASKAEISELLTWAHAKTN